MKGVQLAVIALAAGSLLTLSSVAQEKKENPAAAQSTPDQQEMMKKWMEVSTPKEPHNKLNALEGKWDVEMKIWENGPDKPPTVSKGTSVKTWTVGHRFLREEYSGFMMGMPFEGVGYTGYDNYNKKYVASWVDNTTTQMLTMSGVMDKEGKLLTLYGTTDDWMMGENGKPVKYVTRIADKDKNIFEVFDLSLEGPNTKMMEATYTRAK